MPIDWLIFAWVYLLLRQRKRKAIEISHSDARPLVTFLRVSFCDNRERVLMFDYDTKEKEHQNTRQSD
jgi:hypothetical protein